MRPTYRQTLVLAALMGSAVAISGCASTRTTQAPGEYTDDAVITGKVKTMFLADKTVSAANVNVETFRGVVQLSGFANSQKEIDQAVTLAKTIKGVTSVKNDIRLKSNP
ncbi:MAG: BON domain-containing protein [Gammaproteobacteria bacterium]